MLTDKDGKPGLRIESAASVVARDMIQNHLHTFAHVIMRDRAAGKSTHIEFVNGLAGVIALLIAGGHGGRDEIVTATIEKLREYVNRDLQRLAGLQ